MPGHSTTQSHDQTTHPDTPHPNPNEGREEDIPAEVTRPNTQKNREKIPLVFDMETSDPDDFLTLLLLLGHPRADLRAVTITPGTPAQVGLVRWALRQFSREIPVGVHRLDAVGSRDISRPEEGSLSQEERDEQSRRAVSGWHYRAFGEIPPSSEAVPAGPLLARMCQEAVTLLTGAPLKNLGAAMQVPGFHVGRWVAQGGFAGEGVVPPHEQLEKFKGRRTCPTFNLNGDPKSALAALSFAGIRERYFVSKNVCHGVVYDAEMHARVGSVKEKSLSLSLIWKGMDAYLARHSAGKAFHDPLAACCALDLSVGRWAEVELFRERGEWGARLSPGAGTQIIVGYDRARFVDLLCEF
jgi:pyrimidine-specific ribonucleoside hydrolase